MDEFLHTENANLVQKNFLSRIIEFWRLPHSHISIVDNKVSAEHADLMNMIHLMKGKVMTGQESIDLADPQEKMCSLNPHSRIGFMIPGIAFGALLAVAAWVVYFGVSSLLFTFGWLENLRQPITCFSGRTEIVLYELVYSFLQLQQFQEITHALRENVYDHGTLTWFVFCCFYFLSIFTIEC